MKSLILDDLDIDSIVNLLKSSFRIEDWDKMITIADKLYLSAQLLEKQKPEQRIQHNRHLVYYFGFSQLAKGIALQNKNLYVESKMLIEKYSDLSLLDDGSKEAQEEIQFFKSFAEANMLAINVLEGKQEYLESYVQLLKQSEMDDIMAGLLNIIEASIKYGFKINEILQSFENELSTAIDYYKNKRPSY